MTARRAGIAIALAFALVLLAWLLGGGAALEGGLGPAPGDGTGDGSGATATGGPGAAGARPRTPAGPGAGDGSSGRAPADTPAVGDDALAIRGVRYVAMDPITERAIPAARARLLVPDDAGAMPTLEVAAPGYFPALGPPLEPAGALRTVTVLLLRQPVTLQGTVRSEEGHAVYEAQVRTEPLIGRGDGAHGLVALAERMAESAVPSPDAARCLRSMLESGPALSDSAGGYRVPAFPGSQTTLSAWHPHYFHDAQRSRAAVRVGPEDGPGPELRLGGGGAAALAITWRPPGELRPPESLGSAPGLVAFIHAKEAGRLYAREASLGAEPIIGGLPPGPAHVVLHPLHVALDSPAADLALVARETTTWEPPIVSARPLEGSVRDVAGRAVADARLVAAFRFPGLPALEGDDPKPVEPPADLIRRAKHAAWEIGGRVWLAVTSDRDGQFRLAGLPPAGGEITVHFLGERRWKGPGRPGTTLDIRLPDTAPDLLVSVPGAKGLVVVATMAGQPPVRVALPGDGSPAAFRGLRPGGYGLVALPETGSGGTFAVGSTTVTVERVATEVLVPYPAARLLLTVDPAVSRDGAQYDARVGGHGLAAGALGFGVTALSLPARCEVAIELRADGCEPVRLAVRLEPGEERRLTVAPFAPAKPR